MYSYENEQKRLQQLMQEVLEEHVSQENYQDPDNANDQSDQDETDHEVHEEHHSDIEQDVSDSEEFYELSTELSFIGKDKKTYWRKRNFEYTSRKTRQENIIKRLPGSTAATRSLISPIEIWNYFITDEIITIIVDSTNAYIETVKENFSRARDANPTTTTEIKALIGLLYLAGVYKANRMNAEDLWQTDGTGVEIFRLVMSLQRFRFLLRCLRFDDKRTREERRLTDKLAPVRNILEQFTEKCQSAYHISAFATIDEMLPGFRGKCPFRIYIPSKPNKYGIKIFSICDAKLYYVSKIEVYAGEQPDGPYKLSNSPTDVVLRLCEHIKGTSRNITMDNWFTSVPLVKTLLEEYKLTVIGTIRKNKRELPLEFSKPIPRPDYSSMFAFSSICTLVSYIPKPRKNVLLVSSLHKSDEIDFETGHLTKPCIITEYNSTKGGVDTCDRLCANYDCSRNTRRWPMVIFYFLLNVAGINSQIVYSSNTPNKKILRRAFLKQLANELITPHLEVRSTIQSLPTNIRFRLRDLCQNGTNEGEPSQNRPPSRCAYCDWRKNRKSRFSCFQCNTHMCLEHIIGICRLCQEKVLHAPI